MASKVIVSTISTLEPSIEAFFRLSPFLLNIAFQDGSSARLDPATPIWAQWAFAFSELERYGLPVYVETDPDTGVVLDYRVPVSGRVARLDKIPRGGYRILLEGVFCYFVLRESNPSFARFADTLLHARASGSEVILTKKDEPYEIADIRITSLPCGPAPKRTSAASCVKDAGDIPPVALECAKAMFTLVNNVSCVPQAATSSCIPFLFPDYGCEARAHRMCELISGAGVTPAKVLSYASPGEAIDVETPSIPGCHVTWPAHIAPVLQVTTAGGGTDTYVIDPSLCHEPVTLDSWIAIQAGSAGHYLVSRKCYEPQTQNLLGPWNMDPDNSLTDPTLVQCRHSLGDRHPPYRCA